MPTIDELQNQIDSLRRDLESSKKLSETPDGILFIPGGIKFALASPQSTDPGHKHTESAITDLTHKTDFNSLDDVVITSGAQGDVFYNNGTNKVNLAPGTDGQFLQTQGGSADPQWADAGTKLFMSTDNADVSNTALETDLFSFSLPGGTLGTNNAVRGYIHIVGLRIVSGSFTVTLRLKYGGTTLISRAFILNLTTEMSGSLIFLLTADGATNAQDASMLLHTEINHVGDTASVVHQFGTANGATIDSTSAQTLAVSVEFSSADVLNKIKAFQVVVEKVTT